MLDQLKERLLPETFTPPADIELGQRLGLHGADGGHLLLIDGARVRCDACGKEWAVRLLVVLGEAP